MSRFGDLLSGNNVTPPEPTAEKPNLKSMSKEDLEDLPWVER